MKSHSLRLGFITCAILLIDSGQAHAVPSTFTDLGRSGAAAINNAGQMAGGSVDSNGNLIAIVWNGTLATRLGSGGAAAIKSIQTDSSADIELRQLSCATTSSSRTTVPSNTIVRPMLGVKTFRCARALIAGVDTVHLIRNGQLNALHGRASSAPSQFHSLAFQAPAD